MSNSNDKTVKIINILGIDTLRGLAIVFVVLNHIGLRIPLRKTDIGPLLPRPFWSSINFNG